LIDNCVTTTTQPTAQGPLLGGCALIYLKLPDESRPYGGIRFGYLLIDSLVKLGYDATVWHGRKGFRCSWFDNETPVTNGRSLKLEKGDLLLVPEAGGPLTFPPTASAAVTMLVQNHFYIFSNVNALETLPGSYPGWPNARAVICTSVAISDFVRQVVTDELPIHSIPLFVDGARFKPARKEQIIAFMPRKRRDEVTSIVQALRRKRDLQTWTFQAIEGKTERETADILSRAAIFISSSNREGFGLPPAEAMASGCHVVGFTGDGGKEYMSNDLCTIIEDQSLSSFVTGVENAARAWVSNRQLFEENSALARAKIIENYGLLRLEASLETVFRKLCAQGSSALQTEKVTVHHDLKLVNRYHHTAMKLRDLWSRR